MGRWPPRSAMPLPERGLAWENRSSPIRLGHSLPGPPGRLLLGREPKHTSPKGGEIGDHRLLHQIASSGRYVRSELDQHDRSGRNAVLHHPVKVLHPQGNPSGHVRYRGPSPFDDHGLRPVWERSDPCSVQGEKVFRLAYRCPAELEQAHLPEPPPVMIGDGKLDHAVAEIVQVPVVALQDENEIGAAPFHHVLLDSGDQ